MGSGVAAEQLVGQLTPAAAFAAGNKAGPQASAGGGGSTAEAEPQLHWLLQAGVLLGMLGVLLAGVMTVVALEAAPGGWLHGYVSGGGMRMLRRQQQWSPPL